VTTCIALFRGINIGGRHRLPMAHLVSLLEANGCVGVRTYIQSGNAVFRTRRTDMARLAARLSAAVEDRHGFAPRVLILTRAELEQAAADNPFPDTTADPKSLHLFLLDGTPKTSALTRLEALRARQERFALKGRVLYLHTPDGFGRSTLAAGVERAIGVEATARNWRTVEALLALTRDVG
jgi:uncharacterized protein (DUF1697 family)